MRSRRKGGNVLRMISVIHNNLAKLLEKTSGKFDHAKIERVRALQDLANLKKKQESFDLIHEAYMYFREEGKDETEEETLLSKQDKYYTEVMDKICESLKLCADYEESYNSFKAAQPDPELEKKLAEEKNVKEVLDKQLEQEVALQKQESEAVAKAEQEKVTKELRENVLKKEKLFNAAIGKYRTAKKYAEDMTKFARGLSKEQVVSQVMEFAHVRSLPTYDTKNMLIDRLKAATDAAEAFEDAIVAETGVDDVKDKVVFDEVAEDASVQDLVSMLNLLLNAKFNSMGVEVEVETPILQLSDLLPLRLS